jgi:hypothetical protein
MIRLYDDLLDPVQPTALCHLERLRVICPERGHQEGIVRSTWDAEWPLVSQRLRALHTLELVDWRSPMLESLLPRLQHLAGTLRLLKLAQTLRYASTETGAFVAADSIIAALEANPLLRTEIRAPSFCCTPHAVKIDAHLRERFPNRVTCTFAELGD